MSRLSIFVALIVLTMPAASAQEAPAPAVRASLERGATSSAGFGITEQGRGTVLVAADRLKLVIRTFGAPATPGVVQRATAMGEAERAVIETMKANGIPDAHAVTPVLGQLASNDQIAGTIAKPTHDKVLEIETRIIGALPPAVTSALHNTNVSGAFEADSCADAVERARSNAFADARKRADSLAAVAGVHLGALLTATETDQAAGCADQGPPQTAFFINGNEAIADANISVTAYVSATFAIRP